MATELYVSFDPETSEIYAFREPERRGLARDVTQVDRDDVRRVYRRCDQYWLAWVKRWAEEEAFAELWRELVAIFGEARLAIALPEIPPGYRPPVVIL